MPATERDTNGTKSLALSGRALEDQVARLEYERPDLVRRVWLDADGRPVAAQPVVTRAAPRRRGRFVAVNPAELRDLWTNAVARIGRRSEDVTLEAIASELGVSARTASRYRRQHKLTVGDR